MLPRKDILTFCRGPETKVVNILEMHMRRPSDPAQKLRPSDWPGAERLHTAAQSREMDAWTIGALGIPGIVLMEHAGRAVAERIANYLQSQNERTTAKNGPVVVLAGPGNNGGDGWVCARHLWGRQIPTAVLALSAPAALRGDAQLAAETFVRSAQALGWTCPTVDGAWETPGPADAWCRRLDELQPSLVVEAFFGTGLTRPLSAPCDEVVAHCQRRNWPIWSIDLPAGLPTDGQAPQGAVVVADQTLTFGRRKLAHVSEPGRTYCGQVDLVDIGLLESTRREEHRFWRVPPLAQFPRRALDECAHKNRFGHVAVAAGAPRTRGAANLAAHAALRIGAGLVTQLMSAPLVPEPAFFECMWRELEAVDRLAGIDAVVLGPGLGQEPERQQAAASLLAEAVEQAIPLVLDADALPLIEQTNGALCGIATPHPGEAARLLQKSSRDVQSDRIAAVESLQQLSARRGHRLVWVLKGACPIIAAPEGEIWICEGGTPALAVGGSGDVLAGALGGLLASGMDPLEAALRGVRLHQDAGQALGATHERGHFASQISDMVGKLHNPPRLSGIG